MSVVPSAPIARPACTPGPASRDAGWSDMGLKMKAFKPAALLASLQIVSGAAVAADAPHWAYEGAEGPQHWAELTPEFGACRGSNQSPINLSGFIRAELKPIKIAYQAGGREILNNGHTVQVNYAPGSSIKIDGVTYELKQFHFHAPSENLINGKSYALEAHLVHADKDGHLAVLALMFKEGAPNKALARLWSSLPAQEGEKRVLDLPFQAEQLLPAVRSYYRFSGSLTTPPCTEGVRWLVMKRPLTVSHAQVEMFAHLMHHPNNRPVQAVNAREVLE